MLDYIDPAQLDYMDWTRVGMALHAAGEDVSVWDAWSRRDVRRYHEGECAEKYRTFASQNTNNPVTVGTLVHMAQEGGWTPSQTGRAIEWDGVIGGPIIDPASLEPAALQEPAQWEPAQELIRYIETLFQSDERVGYVVDSCQRDGRWTPANSGAYDRTAGQLIAALKKCKGDIGSALGDWNSDAGAWIRFNPLDGNGVRNNNVTDYRYALVESDSIDIDRQLAIIDKLQLPVAAAVHSGGKSIHAIVHVGAASMEEYRKRVAYLYKICTKNGLEIDTQNRNPSRLSRMPGITRGGRKQYLIATNQGQKDWESWHDWIEAIHDDLPDMLSLADVYDDLPALSPCLIDGVLRQGHKMLITGPSKAGKSYALIELCIAIAEGTHWMGFPCARGRVLYVNLELDHASCLHRFRDVYDALGLPPDHIANINIWNLRGYAVPMDRLAPKLIRRAEKKGYMAIIIDPIYKVLTGDENSADQMALFCNQFDRIATNLNCAVIYCHHHSKGLQGAKRSMDRASGSGVFARDPDALLDMIQLNVGESLAAQQVNRAVCDALAGLLDERLGASWRDRVGQDDRLSRVQMEWWARTLLPVHGGGIDAAIDAAEAAARRRTAWRVDGTLREFPHFAPVNVWFDYPIHRLDDCGVLEDLSAEGSVAANLSRSSRRVSQETRRASIDSAWEALKDAPPVTVQAMAEYLNVSMKTVRRRIETSYPGRLSIKNGIVYQVDA